MTGASRRPVERRGRGLTVEYAGPLIAFALFGGLLLWWVANAGYAVLTGAAVPRNPFALPLEQLAGTKDRPAAGAWVFLAVELAVIGAVVHGAWRRVRRPRSRIDAAASRMATGRDLGDLTPEAAGEKAARLAGGSTPVPPKTGMVEAADRLRATWDAGVGVRIGATVAPPVTELIQSWEDCSVDITGARRGKTSARVIPAVLEAPGSVLVTTNKYDDLLQGTRMARELAGPVTVYDPQHLATNPDLDPVTDPVPWFDPLRYVHTHTDAAKLVEIWQAAHDSPNSRTDSYWSGAAAKTLACLFLAAAKGDKTLVDVYRWALDSRNEEPAELLAAAGEELAHLELRSKLVLHDKQRDGIWDGLNNWLSPLADQRLARWAVPGPGSMIDPTEFVASGNSTLYLLSQEGPGSAGALIGALTQAILDEGIAQARHGRLDPALLLVLDEVANVCRLPRLPQMYSHLGSRGIAVMAFLQSYAQGEGVWGDKGMATLWSAATIRVYGGGETNTTFLRAITELVGEHDVITTTQSHSTSRGSGTSRSVSDQHTKEHTLTIDLLGGMDKWRAVLLAPNTRPAMIQTQPWWDGPYAELVVAGKHREATRAA